MRSSLLAISLLYLAACAFEGTSGPLELPNDDPEQTPGDGNGGGGGGSGSGSGSGVTDTDGDGVPDSTDNCRTVSNAEQYNEDGDLFGDACDNCPHLANSDQADNGETGVGATADGIGDACDPNPTRSGDQLALFLGFNEASDFAGWSVAGDQDFTVANGKLQNRVKTNLALAWNNDLNLTEATLVTKVNYLSLSSSYRYHGVAVVGRFRRNDDLGTGVGCGELEDEDANGGNPFRNGVRYNGGSFTNNTAGNTTLAAGTSAVYRATMTINGATCYSGNQTWSVSSSSSYRGAALSVWGASVDLDYLVAYKR